MNLALASTFVAIGMATMAMFVRAKAAKKPATAMKIIMPPLGMSTGSLMYILPEFRLTGMEIAEAVVLGMLFSTLLIKTSSFEVKEGNIYVKRSKAFFFILIGLFAVRLIMKWFLSSTIDLGELSGMFFLLAFSMIVPWRIAMYISFKKIQNKLQREKQPA